MTPRERVLQAIHHGKPDRVPINYMSNPGIDSQLKKHYGLKQDDNEGLLLALGVDLRRVSAPYIGKPLHTGTRTDRFVDPWHGWVTRYIEHDSGAYWDYCDFPLIEANEETIAAWPFPNPDDFDYTAFVEQAKALDGFSLHLGDASLGCIINTCGFLRGMEQVLIDLATDEPAGLLLIDKLMRWQIGKLERELDAVHKYVDMVWIGEDLGTQHSPLISPQLLHKHILPWHKQFIDMAAAYNLPAMMHTCGSSSWAYEDYIAAGLKGVETLQPEATNMDTRYLKDTFGGRLFFHGCLSTAGPLAYGTTNDVIEDVRNTLEIMMPGAGYIFSSTHCIQDNSPLDNVIAMYDSAKEFGRYI